MFRRNVQSGAAVEGLELERVDLTKDFVRFTPVILRDSEHINVLGRFCGCEHFAVFA
jgi:hypothetical protein